MERFVIQERSAIDVGRALLAEPVLPAGGERSGALIVTQPSVATLAADVAARLEVPSRVEVVPDGDAAKTLAVAETLYQAGNDMGLTRHDCVIGIGGGAVTDLAGFVAATYLRGIEAVLVPTTVLGAVDAAIGGKTAVNVGGKNLVGSFHLPSRVVIDLDVLDRLPDPIKREGFAEAIKAGLIADPELLDVIERDGLDADLAVVVGRAVAVKAHVVDDDLTERGRRMILNYGHTVGHGLEIAGAMSHGDAVAVGMVAEGAISERMTGFEHQVRQTSVLAAVGLPVLAPPVDASEVIRLLSLDKKRDRSGIRMVLLRDIADPVVEHVDPASLAVGLAAVGVDYPPARP